MITVAATTDQRVPVVGNPLSLSPCSSRFTTNMPHAPRKIASDNCDRTAKIQKIVLLSKPAASNGARIRRLVIGYWNFTCWRKNSSE